MTVMNKPAIATILAAAALGIAKKASGSRNNDEDYKEIRAFNMDELYPLLSLRGWPQKRSEVKSIYISVNNLDVFPIDLCFFPNLKKLNIIARFEDSGKIKEIPSEIGNLTNLEELYLTGHSFKSIPPEIGKLTKLKRLYLEMNGLTSLPPEIGKLTNLEWLKLNDNQLTSLPPEIGKLTNLKQLNLEDNDLRSVPMEICNLTNLEWCDSIEWFGDPDLDDGFEIDGVSFAYNENLKIPPTQIKRMIQLGKNPKMIKTLIRYVDTTPTTNIRRF